MPKFQISGEMTISIHTDVEADTPEEAIEIANSRSPLGLCHQCSRGSPDEEWCTSGELDGLPVNLTAEEQEVC